MEYRIERDAAGQTIRLSGRLSFQAHAEFRNLLKELISSTRISVDLSRVDFIDSAGLGLIFLLRDKACDLAPTLDFFGAQGQPKKMLHVTRFDELVALRD